MSNDDDLDFHRVLPPVRPLMPPDGAFERIVLTAARRRRRRVMLSVATSVSVVAIAVAGVVIARTQFSSNNNNVSAAVIPSTSQARQTTQAPTSTYTGGVTQSGTILPDPSADATSATNAKCAVQDLALTLTPVRKATVGAASYEGLIVVFTNKGSAACHLSDYPGVMLIGGAGGLDAARGGSVMWQDPAPTYVTLAPHGSASAGLEWRTGVAGCSTLYTSAQVTPPETFVQFGVTLPVPVTSCSNGGLAVTRLTAGTTGPALQS